MKPLTESQLRVMKLLSKLGPLYTSRVTRESLRDDPTFSCVSGASAAALVRRGYAEWVPPSTLPSFPSDKVQLTEEGRRILFLATRLD